MNIGKIYSEATGMAAPHVVEAPVTEVKRSIKIEWLQAAATQDLITDLEIRKKQLLEKAIGNALTYSEHQNHFRIIETLIRYNELDKQLNIIKNT